MKIHRMSFGSAFGAADDKRVFRMRVIFCLLAVAVVAAVILTLLPKRGNAPATVESGTDSIASKSDEVGGPLTLDGVIETLNAEHLRRSSEAIDTEALQPDYRADDFIKDEFSDEELAAFKKEYPDVQWDIPYEGAVRDVDLLFRLLRTSYGAYELMGGDERFGAAKADIISALDRDWKDGISTHELRDLMIDKLDFVVDSHFTIGGFNPNFREQYFYFDSRKAVFRRDGSGYYTYFEDMPDVRCGLPQEYERYMRVTIAESGELVYGLFALSDEAAAEELPRSITLTCGDGSSREYDIDWQLLSKPELSFAEICYSLTRQGDIPVVSMKSFMLNERRFDAVNSFLNDAEGLKNEPALILDLCGNGGGYDCVSTMWLYGLTGGQMVDTGVGYVSYVSRLAEYIFQSDESASTELFARLDFSKAHPEFSDMSSGVNKEYTPGELFTAERKNAHVAQDRLIFAVCDKATSSAGEMMLFQLENMDNVVVVGSNTNGCLISGGVNLNAPVTLPNSYLPVSFGIHLVTHNRMDDYDARGFMPDIVVDPKNAAELIARCVEYYGLG